MPLGQSSWSIRLGNARDWIRDYTDTIDSPDHKITELLRRLRLQGNDEGIRGELVEAVYAALHRIAQAYLLRERSDHTLQPTALVNEAYLRLFGGSDLHFADRVHFYALAARIMRRILVDHARARAARQGSASGDPAPLNTLVQLEAEAGPEFMKLLELDLALEALGRERPWLVEVIEMRYFAGMTAEETAEAVGRSVHVVRHDLRLAHAWLRRELSRDAQIRE